MILPWYQLVSPQNLLTVSQCSSHFLLRKLRCFTWEIWSMLMARCFPTARRMLQTNIWKSNSNQHDLLEFECLPSLQRSPLTLLELTKTFCHLLSWIKKKKKNQKWLSSLCPSTTFLLQAKQKVYFLFFSSLTLGIESALITVYLLNTELF